MPTRSELAGKLSRQLDAIAACENPFAQAKLIAGLGRLTLQNQKAILAALHRDPPDAEGAEGMRTDQAGRGGSVRNALARAICMASGHDPDWDYDPKGVAGPPEMDIRWRLYLPHADACLSVFAAARLSDEQAQPENAERSSPKGASAVGAAETPDEPTP